MNVRASRIPIAPATAATADTTSYEAMVTAMRQVDGFLGAMLLIDRATGSNLGLTFWENEEALRAPARRWPTPTAGTARPPWAQSAHRPSSASRSPTTRLRSCSRRGRSNRDGHHQLRARQQPARRRGARRRHRLQRPASPPVAEHHAWSQLGTVRATVQESNIFQPGGTWELRATAQPGRGFRVEVSVRRQARGARGHLIGALMSLMGATVAKQSLQKTLAIVAGEAPDPILSA